MTKEEKLEKLKDDYKRRKHEAWVAFCKANHPQKEFRVFGDDVKKLLNYMESVHYSQSVVDKYRRYLNRFDSYCFRNQIAEFKFEKADVFIKTEIPTGQQVSVRNVITRFQSYLKTGRITTKRACKYKAEPLSSELEKLLSSYSRYNKQKGNHLLTVSKKEKLAREFLRRCACNSLEEINSEKISEAVTKTKNKDEWSYARLFFKFCLETKRVSFEYGALIPKERRIQKLPSTYSIDEISLTPKSDQN